MDARAHTPYPISYPRASHRVSHRHPRSARFPPFAGVPNAGRNSEPAPGGCRTCTVLVGHPSSLPYPASMHAFCLGRVLMLEPIIFPAARCPTPTCWPWAGSASGEPEELYNSSPIASLPFITSASVMACSRIQSPSEPCLSWDRKSQLRQTHENADTRPVGTLAPALPRRDVSQARSLGPDIRGFPCFSPPLGGSVCGAPCVPGRARLHPPLVLCTT